MCLHITFLNLFGGGLLYIPYTLLLMTALSFGMYSPSTSTAILGYLIAPLIALILLTISPMALARTLTRPEAAPNFFTAIPWVARRFHRVVLLNGYLFFSAFAVAFILTLVLTMFWTLVIGEDTQGEGYDLFIGTFTIILSFIAALYIGVFSPLAFAAEERQSLPAMIRSLELVHGRAMALASRLLLVVISAVGVLMVFVFVVALFWGMVELGHTQPVVHAPGVSADSTALTDLVINILFLIAFAFMALLFFAMSVVLFRSVKTIGSVHSFSARTVRTLKWSFRIAIGAGVISMSVVVALPIIEAQHRASTIADLRELEGFPDISTEDRASSQSPQARAADAIIKQHLANIRSQAEISYNMNNFSYASVCSDARVVSALEQINERADRSVCQDGPDQYAVAAPLASGRWWCVDATGYSDEISREPSGSTCTPGQDTPATSTLPSE